MNEQRRCGNCKWWEQSESNDYRGVCGFVLRHPVLSHGTNLFQLQVDHDSGIDCPTWAAKKEGA